MKFLQSISTSANLVFRSFFRTKTQWLIFVLIFFTIFLLPLFESGAETVAGGRRVVFGLGLSLSIGFLIILTLCQSCSIISRDIETHRFVLTQTKPVSTLVLWVGRWLGILFINTIYVAVLYLTLLLCQIKISDLPEGRFVIHPEMPPIQDSAEKTLTELTKKGLVPPGFTHKQLLNSIIKKEPNRYETIETNEPVQLRYKLENNPKEDVIFQIRTSGISGAKDSVKLQLLVNGTIFQLPQCLNTGTQLSLPRNIFHVGENELILTRTDTVQAANLLFRMRKDVVLLVDGISFSNNSLRYVLSIWIMLAVVAAFGLLLGCCFSTPVAIFTGAASLLILMASATGLDSISLITENSKWWLRLGGNVSRITTAPFSFMLEYQAQERLLAGEALNGQSLLEFLLHCGELAIMPMLLGSFILKRRQIK